VFPSFLEVTDSFEKIQKHSLILSVNEWAFTKMMFSAHIVKTDHYWSVVTKNGSYFVQKPCFFLFIAVPDLAYLFLEKTEQIQKEVSGEEKKRTRVN